MLNDKADAAHFLLRDRKRHNHFIPKFLVQHIKKDQIICSAGCGTGYDVFLLNEMGYDAFGFDPGKRTEVWSQYDEKLKSKLRMGFSTDFPFGKNAFDFIYALEVIEHVGCKDGIWELLDDHKSLRSKFIVELLDMLKPKGSILLTVANRLFPVDPGHGHHYHWITDLFARKTRLRITIPWHSKNFLVSFKDIQKLISDAGCRNKVSIQLASSDNFLSFSSLKNYGAAGNIIKGSIKSYYKAVNYFPFTRYSFLNPFLVVLIKKLN